MAKKTSKPASKKPAAKPAAKKLSKSTAKPAKQPAKKAAKQPAKKAATASSKQAPGTASLEPRRISTGTGPNPEQIGRSLVEMFNAGQFAQIDAKWWSPAIESIEGMGMGWSGRKAVEAKNKEWMATNEIIGASAEGPYVGATGFGVKFRMEIRERATGKQTRMEEVGVYTVENGKIIREEFMYGMF